jgi:hypothetical protein
LAQGGHDDGEDRDHLSLLQEAALQAQVPKRSARQFAIEQRAAGLAESSFDTLDAGARMVGTARLFAPGVGPLLAGIADDLVAMLAPLEAAREATSRPLAERAAALKKAIPAAEGDHLELSEIDGLASAKRGERDSVHLLVMDLHKAINRLAADTAMENLDGARVHSLGERERRSVRAFMRGLNRTAPLAFGHPGLGTTAVRAGGASPSKTTLGRPMPMSS